MLKLVIRLLLVVEMTLAESPLQPANLVIHGMGCAAAAVQRGGKRSHVLVIHMVVTV